MPSEVIESVHALARRRKSSSRLNFGWRDGYRIVADDKDKDHNDQMEDTDYNPADDGSAHYDGDEANY